MDLKPLHFIGHKIEVEFDTPPAREKAPHCPNRFIWRETTYTVDTLLSEWHDFTRRGRMARNMRPAHLSLAAETGSLGVGRYFFRVHTTSDQVFDLYYDRAVKNADQRKGEWVLYRELSAEESPDDAASDDQPPES